MGFGDIAAPLATGLFGMFQEGRARAAAAPAQAALRETPGIRDAVSEGRGTQDTNVAVGALDEEYRNALSATGLGSQRGGRFQLTTQPGQTDYGAARYLSESNRYAAEAELEADQRDSIANYRKDLAAGESNFEGAYADTAATQRRGNQVIQDTYAQGRRDIATGQEQVTAAYNAGATAINSAMTAFSAKADSLLSSVESLKTEGMAAFQDQTAKLLETASSGVQHKLASQIAELEGRTDLPPATKQALKERLSMSNGIELNSLVSDVYSKEHQRFTETALKYDSLITGTMDNITAATSTLSSAAVQAGGRLSETAMSEYSKLSDSAARLGTAFAGEWSNWNTQTQGMKNSIKTALAGFRMMGDDNLYNMVSSMSRAYIDLGGVASDLMNTSLQLNSAEYQRNADNLNSELAVFGFGASFSTPYYQSMMSGFSNAISNEGGGGGGGGGDGGPTDGQVAASISSQAAQGAMAGNAVLPGWGAVIGGIGGAAQGYFGSGKG